MPPFPALRAVGLLFQLRLAVVDVVKKLVDDAVIGLMKNGELDKLYTRWFLAPIPPKNANLNFPMSETLKKLIKAPSDAPAESFNKK